MYMLAIQRDFIAQHFLVGGDWGHENQRHAHHYRVEVKLEGEDLDQHGYLVDIVHLESLLEELVDRYRDQLLNEMPEFKGLNPSIEHFTRILYRSIDERLVADNICAMTVKIWENEIAWAAFRQVRACG